MIAAFFLLACILFSLCVIAFQHRRAGKEDPVKAATIFETRINPPFLRPVVTRLEDNDLKIDAPVVHARLVGDILVLDIKSNSGAKAEGFELAVTGFDMKYLKAEKYHFFPSEGHLLVGPQGACTDRLLQRAAKSHGLDLPSSAGTHVQAFAIEGIVTDPGDFRVEIQAILPSGAPLHIAYDYARASVHARVHASAFNTQVNFQPLGVKLEVA